MRIIWTCSLWRSVSSLAPIATGATVLAVALANSLARSTARSMSSCWMVVETSAKMRTSRTTGPAQVGPHGPGGVVTVGNDKPVYRCDRCDRSLEAGVLMDSPLPFDEWTEVFGSERLTGALLDRLTHPRPHPGDERRELPPQAQQGERCSTSPGRIRQPISRARSRPHSLTHPPSLLPACLCDTSPEQLARTFTLANDLSGGTLLLRPTGMFCRRP